MDARFYDGTRQLAALKSQQASYLDNINRMILNDGDFEYMHVPALAQRLEVYKRKFLEFDQDSSGYLDYNEFKEMLQTIGAAKSDVKCKKLFKRCRQSTRNVLYYRDFVDMILADTLRLGIMFDEEQEIINKVEMMKKLKTKKGTSPPSELSTISDGVRDMGIQCDEEGQSEEDQDGEEDYGEDYRSTVDRGVQYTESEYDGQGSVFSYRTNSRENEEDQDEEQEEEEEDGEAAPSESGVQEANDEEQEEDEEEVREVKEVRESRVVDRIGRGVENVQLLRSEAPQGQQQDHRPPSYRGRSPTAAPTAAPAAAPTAAPTAAAPRATGNLRQAALVSEQYQRSVPNNTTELYPSRALVPVRNLPGGNPPPIVCSTRNLPPEASTKIPVSVGRQVPPAPYTYVCTDPACPDSYPKPQPPPVAPPAMCRDPHCPYQPQPPARYQHYVQPVLDYVPDPEQYVEYHQPAVQTVQKAAACPYGHRCVSPQPGYEIVPVQNGHSSVDYGAYPDQTSAYTILPDQRDIAYAPDVRLEYGAQPYYVIAE